MKGVARLLAGMSLVALALVVLPGKMRADNEIWWYSESFDKSTNEPAAYALSNENSGTDSDGVIFFRCIGTDLASNFTAIVKVRKDDFYPAEKYDVTWSIDEGPEPKSIWQRVDGSFGGLQLVGPRALELAFEMLRARKQVEIKTVHGSVVNNLIGYKEAIARMLKHCVTPYVRPF